MARVMDGPEGAEIEAADEIAKIHSCFFAPAAGRNYTNSKTAPLRKYPAIGPRNRPPVQQDRIAPVLFNRFRNENFYL
jgi:hypothetical protein